MNFPVPQGLNTSDTQPSEVVKQLRLEGDKMFTNGMTYMSLCQEIADQFYPERADFTFQRSIYQHFANMLTTSYPLHARRDLASTLSTMLRDPSKEWFYMQPRRSGKLDIESRQWLERAATIMRGAMYDKNSGFVRATKEGDNDFAAFGQAVISVELNTAKDGMLYRCWHLRDCRWSENNEGKITRFHRNWKPQVTDLLDLFGKGRKGCSVSPKLLEVFARNPLEEVLCRHIVVPYDAYTSTTGAAKFPQGHPNRPKFWSIYLDVGNDHVMEETAIHNFMYVIPRWLTVSGSQYAFSPCATAGLPDGRLMQSMALTLLEAGEWGARPPMIATEEAVRSDLGLYSGGVTWVDPEYDERMGAALRPLELDHRGMPVSLQMYQMVKDQIDRAWYLNQIGLPPVESGMTAFEVGQRVAEWIRKALPLFEPMETEYNGGLCEITFDILMRAGAFGPMQNVPQGLRGESIDFKFVGPLTEAKEQQKGQLFLQGLAIVAEAAKLDQDAPLVVDTTTALTDALQGTWPASWMRAPAAIAAIKKQKAQAAASQQTLANLEQAGMAAKNLGDAATSVSTAQQTATANPQM